MYLKTFDDTTEVPPADLLPASYSRVTPYLYSDEEIERLMAINHEQLKLIERLCAAQGLASPPVADRG